MRGEKYIEYYIARHPIFDRRKRVFGYKLFLCDNLRNYYFDLYKEPDNGASGRP